MRGGALFKGYFTEVSADDDTDCHVNDVSAHCERLKILQEAAFSHFFLF